MTKKKKLIEHILIMYLTISAGLGILITIAVIWLNLQLKNESDPNPNAELLYILLIIPQILGILTGIIISAPFFEKYRLQESNVDSINDLGYKCINVFSNMKSK